MKNCVLFVLIAGAAILAPAAARACACGCGVFDVGTGLMLPYESGGMFYTEFDFQDQNRNWANTGPAPAANNGDKDIRTDYTTYALQYMFNRSWGIQVEVPYDFRDFKTLGGPMGSQVVSLKWSSVGDVRIQGIYTGFSEDMSAGLTFGLKLPTGDFTHNDAYGDIDRDSEIGTGSTDLLLGGFYRHSLGGNGSWTWFAQGLADIPTLTQAQYQPGTEFDAAAGVYYKGWNFGHIHVTPLEQVIGSIRGRDDGDNAAGGVNDDPSSGTASGYQRVMLSQGVEISIKKVDVYADVEIPVMRDNVGNQLVAPWLFKMYVSYKF